MTPQPPYDRTRSTEENMAAERAWLNENPLRIWVEGEGRPDQPDHFGNSRRKEHLREYAYYWADGFFRRHPNRGTFVVLVQVGDDPPFRYEAKGKVTTSVALSHANNPTSDDQGDGPTEDEEEDE